MLEPVTNRMTDDSTEKAFAFAFYCDRCGRAWKSVPVSGATPEGLGRRAREDARRRAHDAAYERANLEALQHFNRCPMCKRWVCDACFLLLDEGDLCRDCTGGSKERELP